MGSSMDSRYWVCPSCCTQFDWQDKKNGPETHDAKKCEKDRATKRKAKTEAKNIYKGQ